MRQRLGEVEGRARSDWARADSMLRDAMAEVVDKAQVSGAICPIGQARLPGRLVAHTGFECAHTTIKSACRWDWYLCTPFLQVVCATCTGAGDSMLAERLFRVVVIDEATQATEPAVLVPLTRGAQCVVMAGDPKQLPPTIVSPQAFDFALDVTLFDRISENGVMPLLLDTQVGSWGVRGAACCWTHRWGRCLLG